MLPVTPQAYSENSIEEMREQKEKGGMDNLEMFGMLSTIQGYFGISRQGLVREAFNKKKHFLIDIRQ